MVLKKQKMQMFFIKDPDLIGWSQVPILWKGYRILKKKDAP